MSVNLQKPSDFTVSQRAADEMMKFMRSYETEKPRASFVIGLAWASRVIDGNIFSSGPGVGIEMRDNVRPEDIVTLNGVEIAMNMTADEAQAYSNKELDYTEGKFVLREK